ncbi:tRNA (adenine(22)-N(1))-methyltransferase TrmK [Latilactobacillus sakei]
MSPINLSKRLAAVAQFVPQDSIVADIGSDHAYLPIWLTEQKRLKGAIAGEVVARTF